MASFSPKAKVNESARQFDRLKLGSESSNELPIKAKPSLKVLISELEKILDWQILMIKLGVEKHHNDKIERNFPHDVDRQKQEALDRWLRATPNACWKDIIDALFEMKEDTLARNLTKKYDWKDPRVWVKLSYWSAPRYSPLTLQSVPHDLPCKRFLPPLRGDLKYYTLQCNSLQPLNESSAQGIMKHFARLIADGKLKEGYNLLQFFEQIEKSDSRYDLKVGIEARFGKVYWKLSPHDTPGPQASLTRDEWRQSKKLRKCAFHTEVDESDVEILLQHKEQLGKIDCTWLSVDFIVEGQDEGIYSAFISTFESGEMFSLDAVYRKPAIENTARINMALPGRKYDFRISDCVECMILMAQTSTPYSIADTIARSLCRLLDRKLHLILHGKTEKGSSTWKVKHIRQCVQNQYKWKPEKKWVLARYDVDVFNSETNESVNVGIAPLNEAVDIPEFDYSRKEIEFWGRMIFPKDVNKTHPSRKKYYYIEGVDGVKLPGGEFRPPYNWTAKDLMNDFEEFFGDALKIAHILDGSPY